jgi:ubiquinol-cytochrome c reductase cytochrome b subunit
MKKLILCLVLLVAPVLALANEAVELQHIRVDSSNKESLQRGAKYYVNYCMGCHSLKYMRWERMADDLQIPHELVQQYLNPAGTALPGYDAKKIGELMTIAANEKTQKRWFGATPPDLSLEARLHGGPDWVYTYLVSFYKDESRPYGVNNKVFKDVGMPHVLADLQGTQECEIHTDDHGNKHAGECKATAPGSLKKGEYESMVYDLVNFLDYAAEPAKAKRISTGFWALFYVLIFIIAAVFLNNEYWKDVH